MVGINLVAVGMQGPAGPPGAAGGAGTTGATGPEGPTGATGATGSVEGAVVRSFVFDFATADILTGAALYTPTVGDVLLDAWIEIDVAWDGTTPRGDIGLFAETTGFYAEMSSFVDMTLADASDATGVLDVGPATLAELTGQSGPGARRVVPAVFTTVNPVMVCVSQTAAPDGADPGSTTGSAKLYLVTATPGGGDGGGGGGGGGGGLPAWFLTSSTTGSNGAPLGTVTPSTDDVPYLYWDDTAGTGLWITPPTVDAGNWIGLGRTANTVGPGLSFAGGPFLSGTAPVLQATFDDENFWEVGVSGSQGGVGWTALMNYTNSQLGQLILSTGNPNTLGISPNNGQLCIDTIADGTGTGIWQFTTGQATPAWVPYGVNTDLGQVEITANNSPQGTTYAQCRVAPGLFSSELGLVSSSPPEVTDWLPVNLVNPGDVIYVDLNPGFSGFPDLIDYSGTIVVWDQAGANVLSATFNGIISTDDGVYPVPLTQVSLIGSDLSVGDAGITSAAGGVYNVLLKASCGWD